MDLLSIIDKKKRNVKLTKAEIEYFISNYVDGIIKDYQMSALLMAICINGLDNEETSYLTNSYINSGDVIDFKGEFKHVVDKHSTGGVGDKTSLIIGPLVASCGVVIAKMSGKGLGHTGGTIDKLESVKGFKVELSDAEFIKVLKTNKFSIISQTKDLAVADKKIYALRDVTSTVDSIPLIAASIMSKKLASGGDTILIDVKVGQGALLSSYEDSVKLANLMVDIGKANGKQTVAVLSNNDQPLGYMIGNKLEVIEAKQFLEGIEGTYSNDLYELCIEIATLLVMKSLKISKEQARKQVCENLENKQALAIFNKFIELQGGQLSDIMNLDVSKTILIKARQKGYVSEIDALQLAYVARDLGAGRFSKDDKIDYNVGIELVKKVNDKVNVDDVLAKVYVNKIISDLEEQVLLAFKIDKTQNRDYQLIYQIIE